MSDLELIKREVLSLSPDVPVDRVADAIGRLDCHIAAALEVKALLKGQILEYVRENGPFEVGDIRWYEGTEKKTVCRDTRATAEAVLEATAGDLDTFCQQLSKDPFKYGALKTLLGAERWKEFFEVVETPSLEQGKPAKKLLTINTKYAGGRG